MTRWRRGTIAVSTTGVLWVTLPARLREQQGGNSDTERGYPAGAASRQTEARRSSGGGTEGLRECTAGSISPRSTGPGVEISINQAFRKESVMRKALFVTVSTALSVGVIAAVAVAVTPPTHVGLTCLSVKSASYPVPATFEGQHWWCQIGAISDVSPGKTNQGQPSSRSGAALGSRNRPVPFGRSFALRGSDCQGAAGGQPPKVCGPGWSLKINSSIPNADAVVHFADPHNALPTAGNQFYLVNLGLTWHGPRPTDLIQMYEALRAIGRSDVVYAVDGTTNNCGSLPPPFWTIPTPVVGHGGTYTVNVCASVTRSDAKGLLLYATTGNLASPTLTYFATSRSG